MSESQTRFSVLREAADGDVVAAAPIRPTGASLACEGSTHTLSEGENSIGRAADLRVVINHNTVSRHHAVITIYEDGASIRDLGSKNGTFVDGERIGSSPMLLTRNARILIGGVVASLTLPKESSTDSLRLNMPRLLREVEQRA